MIVFIHIPKTAGMSVRKVIAENVTRSLIVDDYAQIAFLKDQQLNTFDAIMGHVGYALLRRIVEPKPIIFLRHPVDRIISMYSYWKYNLTGEYHKFYTNKPFMSFVKSGMFEISNEIDNAMTWQLAVDRSTIIRKQHHAASMEKIFNVACENIKKATFVGFQESFAKDLAAMCAQFGWNVPMIPQENVSKNKVIITTEERFELEEMLYWDMKLYNFAQAEYKLVRG